MSVTIPYSTQIGPFSSLTQPSQSAHTFILVYLVTNMTQSQIDLMKDAQYLLSQQLNVGLLSDNEIDSLPRHSKYFVVPCVSEKVIKAIRNRCEKSIIYTARCVVEARKFRNIVLPVRHLAISLAMVDCRIFITRSLNNKEFIRRINEMCGTILGDFNDEKLNVVITDRADDKYCGKARVRNVAVVSRDWVDDTYLISKNDDGPMNHNAISQLATYQIKPFLGLIFKIPQLADRELRDLISRNGGKLAFGQSADVTHVVDKFYPDDEGAARDNKGPRQVDIEFLRVCDREGYYMNKREYRDYRKESTVHIKQERLSPSPSMMQHNNSFRSDDCFTPPQQNPRSTLSSIKSNNCDRLNDNQSMRPPQQMLARGTRQQGDNMDAIIRKALSSFENSTQQSQLVSTQIRRLPETEIRFERSVESSQQLSWRDSNSRRH